MNISPELLFLVMLTGLFLAVSVGQLKPQRTKVLTVEYWSTLDSSSPLRRSRMPEKPYQADGILRIPMTPGMPVEHIAYHVKIDKDGIRFTMGKVPKK